VGHAAPPGVKLAERPKKGHRWSNPGRSLDQGNQGLLNCSQALSHTYTHAAARTHTHKYTHAPASPGEGGAKGAGPLLAQTSRARKWVGLKHEFIYFLLTSGIKGGSGPGGAQLCLAAGSRTLGRRRTTHTPSSNRQPQAQRQPPSRTNHQSQGAFENFR
jgi:hypothetical protein